MLRILFFVTISFLLSTFSNAETVNQIIIEGNKRISNETIKVYGEIDDVKKNFSSNDLDKILKNLYSTSFFKDVKISIKNNNLFITLEEYPVVNQLVLLGEKSTNIKNEIKKIMSLKEKGSFIKNNLTRDVSSIKKLYSSLGYNFSKIEPSIKKIDKDNLDIIINIKRGEISKISKIVFTGDKKVKEKRLRDIIASEEDRFWKVISRNTKFSENLINLDKRLLTNYYKSLGFYDVKITSSSAELSNTGNVNIKYSIDAGKRYIISKINTNVDPVFNQNIFYPLKKTYEKISGDFYSPFKVKKILDEIDEIIEENNLQFVEHQVQETIEDDKIIISFNIFEGEKVSVERINIFGNTVTNESVIRSELILDEGDPFTKLSLEKSISNIKSRNIFRTVERVVKNGSTNDLKIIDINVEEKPTGEIGAGAGVGTNGGTFAVNIQENNWLGEGKNVGLDFEINRDSVKGQFSFLDPNYDLLGNALRYNITNESNDKPDQGYENSVLSTGVSTSFEQYKNIIASLGLSVSYDDLQTTNTASAALKKQSGEFSELALNYSFAYDQRNRSFMPTDGSITTFSQVLPLYADMPYLLNNFYSSTYHKFSEDIIGAGKFFISTINGLDDKDVRVSKRRFISSKRLRGFQKGKVGPVDGSDHVGGNYAAAINFETNLPNLLPEATDTDISFFIDAGNVWGVDYDSNLDDSNKIRSSTGINANWLSPLGPMTFTFAQNLTKAATDKTESFNFNLGTQF
jgi:outer membrane protein insertion porin family